MPSVLGDTVLNLCRDASGRVLLAAPFVKVHALTRLLDAIEDPSVEVTCITRWVPVEVAAGISDLEVYDRLADRQGSRLLLLPTLHAKVFLSDSRCLIGSANITGRALGWTAPPNLELLAEVPTSHPDVQALVKEMLRSAVPATASYRDAIRRAADELLASGAPLQFSDAEGPTGPAPDRWLPRCTRPDQLWTVYAQPSDVWRVLASNIEGAKTDLSALGIPPGLSQTAFMHHVASSLRAMPLVAEIDARVAAGIGDADAVDLIASLVPSDAANLPAEDAWRVLKDWLAHFFPGAYRRAAEGEIFLRGREWRS